MKTNFQEVWQIFASCVRHWSQKASLHCVVRKPLKHSSSTFSYSAEQSWLIVPLGKFTKFEDCSVLLVLTSLTVHRERNNVAGQVKKLSDLNFNFCSHTIRQKKRMTPTQFGQSEWSCVLLINFAHNFNFIKASQLCCSRMKVYKY